eukprot:5057123-Prymnesium_polylepis.1
MLDEIKSISFGKCGAARGFFRGDTLPGDILTALMVPDEVLGGVHPLSPEYLFNARRACAMSAGLIDPASGELLNVKDELMCPATYFDEEGVFCADREN